MKKREKVTTRLGKKGGGLISGDLGPATPVICVLYVRPMYILYAFYTFYTLYTRRFTQLCYFVLFFDLQIGLISFCSNSIFLFTLSSLTAGLSAVLVSARMDWDHWKTTAVCRNSRTDIG